MIVKFKLKHCIPTKFFKAKVYGLVGFIHIVSQNRTGADSSHLFSQNPALEAKFFWGAYSFDINRNVERQFDHFPGITTPTETDSRIHSLEPKNESGTMTLAEAEKFVTLVNQKIGRYPGLYSGQAFLREKLGSNTITVLKNCFLWLARYSPELPKVPRAWNTLTFRQYTGTATAADNRTKSPASDAAPATNSRTTSTV